MKEENAVPSATGKPTLRIWYSDPWESSEAIQRLVEVRRTATIAVLVHPLHKYEIRVRIDTGRQIAGRQRWAEASTERGAVLAANYALHVARRDAVSTIDELSRVLRTQAHTLATYRRVQRIAVTHGIEIEDEL